MPINKQGHWIGEPNLTPAGRSPGVSDSREVAKAFPGSPFHSGELTDEIIIDMTQRLLLDGVVTDDGVYGAVDRDYSGHGDAPAAPNLTNVKKDNLNNDLSSPYAPSLGSPPGGVGDWANQPVTRTATKEAGQASDAPFEGDGLASPNDTSINIAAQTIGSLRKGASSS